MTSILSTSNQMQTQNSDKQSEGLRDSGMKFENIQTQDQKELGGESRPTFSQDSQKAKLNTDSKLSKPSQNRFTDKLHKGTENTSIDTSKQEPKSSKDKANTSKSSSKLGQAAKSTAKKSLRATDKENEFLDKDEISKGSLEKDKVQKLNPDMSKETPKTMVNKGKEIQSKPNPRLDASKKDTPKTIDRSKLKSTGTKPVTMQDKSLERKDLTQNLENKSEDTSQKVLTQASDQANLGSSEKLKQNEQIQSTEKMDQKNDLIKAQAETQDKSSGENLADKVEKPTLTKSQNLGSKSYLRPTTASMSRLNKAAAQDDLKSGSQEELKKSDQRSTKTYTPRLNNRKSHPTTAGETHHELDVHSKPYFPRKSHSPNRSLTKSTDRRRKSHEILSMKQNKQQEKKSELGVIKEGMIADKKNTTFEESKDKSFEGKGTPRSSVKLGRFAAPTESSKKMLKDKAEASKSIASSTQQGSENKESQVDDKDNKTKEAMKTDSLKQARTKTVQNKGEKVRPMTARAKENIAPGESKLTKNLDKRPITSERRTSKLAQSSSDMQKKDLPKKFLNQETKKNNQFKKSELKKTSKPQEISAGNIELPNSKLPKGVQPLDAGLHQGRKNENVKGKESSGSISTSQQAQSSQGEVKEGKQEN